MWEAQFSDGYPLSLGTSGTERPLIPSTGIPSWSVSDSILTLNGTQLEYRDASSLPANNPINQLLNTTDSIIFNQISQALGASMIYRISPITLSFGGASSIDILNLTIPINTYGFVQLRLAGFGLNAGVVDYGYGEYDYSFANSAGIDSNKSEQNIGSGGYGGKISISPLVSGTIFAIRITSSATFSIGIFGYYKIGNL